MIVKGSCWLGRDNNTLSASVRLVMMRLASGELLALACSGTARHALARYRQRWTRACMPFPSKHTAAPLGPCSLSVCTRFAKSLSPQVLIK
ncbi:hypothetical protein [Bradyrhizobium sp.]|uniref:hypothetical protein n=1 Tax=Bradyrhizobium sp. TaxID=376 RepID=UPI002736F262|nr:hypothetical protein [Bradyrhizobium sp.]MDP3074364.1 hypothetical protein [Bradyrhizobium sp.]